ncbi:MAG TPA: hypothetical protein VNR87_09670 [Flavisolibacter sp.]|nr:hypothetical protein [Flavisolibacter sp.]
MDSVRTPYPITIYFQRGNSKLSYEDFTLAEWMFRLFIDWPDVIPEGVEMMP